MFKQLCLIIFFFFCLSPQNVFANGIVINEILVHPSVGGDEWVEVYNPNNTDLTTYFIDDDTNFADDIGSSKKQLTTISNGTYSVFILSSSMFNNSGDFVVLFDPNGDIVDQYQYTDDPGADVAIGRTPDASGELKTLESATQGSTNSGILPTATATPTKTPTPTRTPTPTHSASSGQAKMPTPTKVSTIVPTKVVIVNTKSPQISISEKNASDSAYPTAVLGAGVSPTRTSPKSPDKKVLVKESSNNNAVIASSLIVGGLFLLACGILVYRRIRHETSTDNE